MDFWLNQALGLLGSLIVFISVQFNNRRVILAAQAAACLMWIVHYGLLGAMTAATVRTVVPQRKGKEAADNVTPQARKIPQSAERPHEGQSHSRKQSHLR